jgi:hypothetical protein
VSASESHLHRVMSSAARLTAIVVVSFSALSTLAALTPASALAAGCTESWASPVSGEWNEAANWSPAKVPTFGDEVCITVTGASPYTVLVHGGADARTLTLGATTGSTQQTLLVQTIGSPGLVKEAELHLEENSTINREGVLELENIAGEGVAQVTTPATGATLSNQGKVTASASPGGIDLLGISLTNEASGTVEAASGTLDLHNYGSHVLNEGAFKVAAGATLGDEENPGTFLNKGTVFDSGTFITEVPTTNEGTLQIASSASVVVGFGGLLTNAANGTIRVDIASETKFGTIKVNRGTFNPGGTIFPNLVEGYIPSVSTLFDVITSGASITGTFATVANGFEGIYSIPDTIAVKLSAPLHAPPAPGSGGGGGGGSGSTSSGTGTTSSTGSGGVLSSTTKALTPAQQLAKAVTACDRLKNKKKRTACVKAAKRQFKAQELAAAIKVCDKLKKPHKRAGCIAAARKKY